jgi:hypothetical protein
LIGQKILFPGRKIFPPLLPIESPLWESHSHIADDEKYPSSMGILATSHHFPVYREGNAKNPIPQIVAQRLYFSRIKN